MWSKNLHYKLKCVVNIDMVVPYCDIICIVSKDPTDTDMKGVGKSDSQYFSL